MGRKFSVKRLEDIAFMASYHEILSNLLLCSKHRPEDRPNTNSYSSLISTNSFLTSENILRYVRNKLALSLVGTFNDEIRNKLISEFNRNLYDSDGKTEPWVFLDCVLDENIVELNAHVAFPDASLNPKLIETISLRSPFVSTVKFNFELLRRKSNLELSLIPFIRSLSVLSHLTNLSLNKLNKRYRSILMHVGQSCPKLTSLSISGFRIVKKDIFALIIGEECTTLEHHLESDETLEHKLSMLQLNEKKLTPICHTIQHLQLEDVDESKKLSSDNSVSPSVIAFLLRHMPNLQTLNHSGTSVSYAVKLLYTGLNNPFMIDHFSFISNRVCQTVDNLLAEGFFASNYKFTGQLSLTTLEFVNICHEETMKAIPIICPYLKNVMFCENPHFGVLTPNEIQVILMDDWPKVQNITFFKVSPGFTKAVLELFQEEIVELAYASIENINLHDLTPCVKLESLRILFDSTISSLPELALPLAESYLPNLKKLESEICLGNWSLLFQEKSSYTHLVLDCCHVATKASEWPRILKMWPYVQTLRIRRSSGLDMSMADTIFHQFSKLKELSLSDARLYCKKEREAFFTLQVKLSQRKVNLRFERSTSNVNCTLLAEADTIDHYETSDGNSSSDYSVDSSHMVGGNFENNGLVDDVVWGETVEAFIDFQNDDYEDYDDSSFGDDLSDGGFDFEF